MSFAKLTPPSPARLIQRERLFARLDAARVRQYLWIAAPAGAGKTSLATSWLAARGTRSLWYRIDEDDADPASFFRYLGFFGAASGVDLPALTPEYLPGLATYARRFFRLLFAAVPTPFALVLDNYQEAPAETPLHSLVGLLAEELPPGAVLLVLSRVGPPPVLARTFLQGTVLGWDDLRFTVAETRQLLDSMGGGDAATVQAATHGWAAGIVLTAHAADALGGSIGKEPVSQAVFDFIAQEFFDRLPAGQRDFLLRVGMLPAVTTSLCAAVTDDDQGMQWLAKLEREHLFVTLQIQTEPTYEFHPLFHVFLRKRREQDLDPPRRDALARRVALALEKADSLRLAGDIWATIGEWGELVRLVCTHAPSLLATGQFALVVEWVQRLPEAIRSPSSWPLFWAASCRLMFDPPAARADFERAYALFGDAGDLAGRWLSWAGIAESFVFGWDSLADFDPWIDELDNLLAEGRGFPSPAVEARTLAGGVALMLHRPDHPLLPIWADRALMLLRSRQTKDHVATLAHFAGFHDMWRGHTQALDAVLEAARASDAPMPPLGRILLGLLELVLANFRGDRPRVEASFAAALAVATEHGVHVMDAPLIQNAALAALAGGDANRLAELIGMARPILMPGRWLEASFQEYLEAGLALLLGDVVKARVFADRAAALVEGQGMPLLMMHICLFETHLDILEGKYEAAAGKLPILLQDARQARCDIYIAASRFGQAHVALMTGDAAKAVEALREALAIGARWNYGHLFLYAAPEAESLLCAQALQADIESGHVRRLIAARGLLPPWHGVELWPWPIRVFSLGGFRLVRADEVVRQSGKPQKRPLDLLKALVAQGRAGAPSLGLAALLWPDATSAGLKKTLEITLHRLRKLLGRDDAVLLVEGRLVLNPRVCWVDLWAFEESAERAMEAVLAAANDGVAIEREASKALGFYAGAFLATDEEAAWMLPARDRAVSRFQRLVADIGQYRERAGRWEAAAELYRSGLEQDNLNEFLYRRLIHCLQSQGRHAEALSVYRRCRELLSIVLGVTPSLQTQSLIQASQEARTNGPPPSIDP
mgnify:FL=1